MGDTIGFKLDCSAGTLTASLNGRDLGPLVEGLPPNAELVWFAECFFGGDSVAIARREHLSTTRPAEEGSPARSRPSIELRDR